MRISKEEAIAAIESATRWGAVSYGLQEHKKGRWLEREEILNLINGLDDTP